MNTTKYTDNLEIDIKDLLITILKKWPILIVGMIIGCALLGGYGFYKNRAAENASQKKLSDEDMVIAEKEYEQYLATVDRIDRLKDYSTDSVLANLDCTSVPTMISLFRVNSDFNTETIAVKFDASLKSRTCINKVINEAKLDIRDNLVTELIRVEPLDDEVVAVIVIGKDKEMCTNISKSLKLWITADLDAEHIDAYYVERSDSNVADVQENYLTLLELNKNSLAKIGTSLSNEQKDYYNALVNGSTSIGNSEYIVSVEPPSAKRYAAVGLIVGLFLPAVFFAVRYAASGTLKTSADLVGVFGVEVFGEISRDKRETEFVSKDIALTAFKRGTPKLMLLSTTEDSTVKPLCDTLISAIANEEGVSASYSGLLLNNASALEKLKDADGVVLVEKRDSSKYKDIAQTVDVCKRYNVPILGAVFVKEYKNNEKNS